MAGGSVRAGAGGSELGARLRSEAARREVRSPWTIARQRFMRHRVAVVSLVCFTLLTLTVYIWAAILPENTARRASYDLIRQAPSWEHPMGTDDAGSDILQRIILGGRVSLTVAITSIAIAMTLGTLVGALAGYYGGTVDVVAMRIVDLILSIPALFLIIILAGVLGPGMKTIILVIGLTGWMGTARIVRANFLSLKNKEFVEAARSIGVGNAQIIFRHILPNTIAPIIVAATLGVAGAILTEAYVSFLGYGIQPPQPSWGNMVSPGSFLLTITRAPWMILFPGMMITLTVLFVNFIGDGLRDALDPRSQL